MSHFMKPSAPRKLPKAKKMPAFMKKDNERNNKEDEEYLKTKAQMEENRRLQQSEARTYEEVVAKPKPKLEVKKAEPKKRGSGLLGNIKKRLSGGLKKKKKDVINTGQLIDNEDL